MSHLSLFSTFVREITATTQVSRVPEPDLVMDDPDKVAAFTKAGEEGGVMAPVYLFHCAHIADVIRPGEQVIDLGCGPATQLAMVARLHPETRFTGVDLSEEMLARARAHVRRQNLTNVDFMRGDITRLDFLQSGSADVVMSTVAAHQLPDVASFFAMIAEIGRVLKPGGGAYIVDFARLKCERSIDYFAHQYADRQPELFTIDYLNSLRAAFSLDEFRVAVDRHLKPRATLHSTIMMPYMAAIKSAPRVEVAASVRAEIGRLRRAMPAYHRGDLRNLNLLFRLGGMRSAALG